MTHNGIEIDQFLLLAIYPCAVFFGIGFIARKTKMKEWLKYLLQAITCFSFAAVYFITIPNGGAQGLAIVLALFGVILLLMAKRNTVFPQEETGETLNSSDNNSDSTDSSHPPPPTTASNSNSSASLDSSPDSNSS